MSGWGGVFGAAFAIGILLMATSARSHRHPALSLRVLPYLKDLHPTGRLAVDPRSRGVVRSVFGPGMNRGAALVERVLGGATSVRRRLERAGLDRTVHQFRIEQVIWGLCCFALAAAVALLRSLNDPSGAFGSLLLCLAAFGFGVLLRDNRLTAQAKERERQMLVEFPVVAELLALAVVAGEGPVAALDRVVKRTRGALAQELAAVLGEVRTGTPVAVAFDRLAARSGLAVVTRFAEGVSVAMERGTPLAEVLHAQAGDVREASRRQLIETGARKEVLMMVPVVFLVLPVTIAFAFWPGAVGLSLVTP